MNNTIQNIKFLFNTLTTSEQKDCITQLQQISSKITKKAPAKWNMYEAALLVDLYFSIKNKTVDRLEGIDTLSKQLRKHAAKKYIINDTYRNNNGIRMRLDELLYIDRNDGTGLRNTSKLFQEMMELHNCNSVIFVEILSTAKAYIID